ncbi:MAG TPA: hypothetical protein DDX54_05365 [Rhodospirillaceae bacterium]|jgi:hypothetical protein|nr:hypothetical protein [Alphaproteobacteria bacterium]HBH26811.1 hypothetical protein [Rhodospirillaceae bacterium]
MSEARLTFVFDGPAVQNGTIDVQALAPALLALGDLIQTANAEINGEKAQISVRVNATAQGSFEVDIQLFQSLAQGAQALWDTLADSKEGLSAANDLADLLFRAGQIAGLLYLLVFLRGKRPDKREERPDGSVSVHIGDTYIITNPKTVRLAESQAVRERARRVASALEREGIEKLSIKRTGQETLNITKQDVPAFDIPEPEDEEIQDIIRRANLQIVSLSFKEDNKWRVTEGAEVFSVDIQDAGFLGQIARDEVAFAKNDYLICELRERQFMTAKGLRKEQTIVRVVEHKSAMRQLRLL